MQANVSRTLDDEAWSRVEAAFESNDDFVLIDSLLNLELFPIKHPFIAYLRKDRTALRRNPETVQRIATTLRGYGLDEVKRLCSIPKESNRQIGPMFRSWMESHALAGAVACSTIDEFRSGRGNRYLAGSDELKKECVLQEFGHRLVKGPDILLTWNGRYVIGEAKLITDFGGHQQTQFDDAMTLLRVGLDAIRIAILDGVIYIREGNSKMQNTIRRSNNHIMSALLLREFLDSL